MRALLSILPAYGLLWLTGLAGILHFIHIADPGGDGIVLRFHMLMVTAALAGLLLLDALIAWLTRGVVGVRPIAWLCGGLLATFHLLLLLYYLVLIVGMKSWGDVITRDLIAGFARELPAMLANMPFSPGPFIIAAAFLALVLMAVHVLLAQWRLAQWRMVLSQVGSVRLVCMSAIGLVVPAVVPSMVWYVHGWDAVSHSEPFARLISDDNARDATGTRRDSVIDERDHALARVNYIVAPPAHARHVVLIVLDAARPDRMSAYGAHRPTTPFLESLVRSGRAMLAKQAYSTCANTACGIGGLLQSQPMHRLAHNGFGLPDALRAAGYRTVFVLSGNHTNYMALHRYYGQAPDVFLDGTSRPAAEVSDDAVVLDELEQLELDAGRPTFLMLHLMSTHGAGRRHATYRKFMPDQVRFTDGAAEKSAAFANHHDNGLVQVDEYLRRVFAILGQKRMLADALVVIASDHGEAMGERGIFTHSQSVYEPEIRVPLFIFDNDLSRYRRQVNVSLMDIAPTVLERLGLPVPAVWKGESLLRPASRRWTSHQMGLYQALIEWNEKGAGLKLIYQSRDRQWELYDLAADPGESVNLFSQRPDDAARLMARLALEQGLVTTQVPFTDWGK